METHVVEDVNDDEDGHPRIELAEELLLELLPRLYTSELLITCVAGGGLGLDVGDPGVMALLEGMRGHIVFRMKPERGGGEARWRARAEELGGQGEQEKASRTGTSLYPLDERAPLERRLESKANMRRRWKYGIEGRRPIRGGETTGPLLWPVGKEPSSAGK